MRKLPAMKREFLINIVFLIGINLLIKPLYIFGIDRTVQNVLPPGDYGYYFALFNFVWLFQIVNDFGIAYYNSRNLSQHRHLLHKYFPNLLALKAALTLAFGALVFVAAALWGYKPWSNGLLWFICLNQALTSLVLFLRSNVAGLGMYRTDSVLSALDRLLVIIVCGALLWMPEARAQFRIEYFVWAQTAALGITAAIAFGVLHGRLGHWQFRLRPAFLRVFFRRSFPYALAVFLMTVYTRVDAVMIEKLLPDGKVEAGIYAAAYRLLDAANIIGFLFAGLLLPIFARMLKTGERAEGLAHFSFSLLFACALPLVLCCWYYGEDIMRLLYHRGDAYYGRVLGVLMWSFLPVCGMYVYGTLLTANENLKRLNGLFAGGLVLNISLNAILIPTGQALGAAVATCITQFAVFGGELYLLREELGIVPGKKMVLRLLAFGAFCFFIIMTIGWAGATAPLHALIISLGFMGIAAVGLLLPEISVLKGFFEKRRGAK
jgi:O-antigen/teichoic acid export membrane protein